MTSASNSMSISQERRHSYRALIVWAVIFFVLLLLRDSYSVGINKYIFLGITCICAFTMKTADLIYLFCFLFPLYVGLPGNYMTLLLLLRLLLETRTVKVSSLFLSFAVCAFIFIQNISLGYTAIVPMMFIPGVILVLLLFAYKRNLAPLPMILMYSAGVAALGFIMLVSTLRVYDFSDLLSNSFRLGSSNVDYASSGIMNVSVDPNYYGMFTISSISVAFPLVVQAKLRRGTKVLLIVFILTQLAVSLIGLSRAFILVFLLWFIMYLLSQKNTKSTIVALIAILAFTVILVNLMPDVIETVLARFQDSDMSTGNGRTSVIIRFWNTWSADLASIFFGVGLFNCNVHCMPLQFLFGGGLILFILVLALFASYRRAKPKQRGLWHNLPFIVTFTMMCTVPVAGLLNFMFPLVFVELSANNTPNTVI